MFRNDRKYVGGGVKKHKILTGRLEGNPKGFAFFIDEEGGEDLFIPAAALNSALHGDRVEVEPVVSARRGSGEAKVVRVLERGNPYIVGTYSDCARYGFVKPDNPRICKDIYIPVEYSLGAKDGQKVVCTVK